MHQCAYNGWVEVEWDGRKAAANVRKHGIDFAEAIVLHDPLGLALTDESSGELRSVTVGMDAFRRLLVVIYVWRGTRIRLISARHATSGERRIYREGK